MSDETVRLRLNAHFNRPNGLYSLFSVSYIIGFLCSEETVVVLRGLFAAKQLRVGTLNNQGTVLEQVANQLSEMESMDRVRKNAVLTRMKQHVEDVISPAQ